MEVRKKINQNFRMSRPLGDGQLAKYLVLEQKDSVQKSRAIITNNRSFTTARIKLLLEQKDNEASGLSVL